MSKFIAHLIIGIFYIFLGLGEELTKKHTHTPFYLLYLICHWLCQTNTTKSHTSNN